MKLLRISSTAGILADLRRKCKWVLFITAFILPGSAMSQTGVGINTKTPDRKLDVEDGSGAPQLRITYTDQTIYTDFQTTGNGYLNIDPSGGNVGIGTLLPSEKLQVAGDVRIEGISGNSTALVQTDNNGVLQAKPYSGNSVDVLTGDGNWTPISTVSPNDNDWIYNGTHIYNGNSGNVGINTTSPSTDLDVNGDIRVNGLADAIRFGSRATIGFTDGHGRFSLYENATTAGDVYLQNEAATRITMNQGGITLYAADVGVAGGTISTWQALGSLSKTATWLSPRGTSKDLYVNSSGNVGIGTTTPSTQLHVQGGARVSSLSGVGSRMVVADATGVLGTMPIPSGGSGRGSWTWVSDSQNGLGIKNVVNVTGSGKVYALRWRKTCSLSPQQTVSLIVDGNTVVSGPSNLGINTWYNTSPTTPLTKRYTTGAADDGQNMDLEFKNSLQVVINNGNSCVDIDVEVAYSLD